MGHTADYEQARGRAEQKYGFFVHVAVYAAVILLLVVINLLTSPGTFWSIWPMIGWGFAVALHWARVFLLEDKTAMIDALTERELRRSSAGEGEEDQ